MNVLKDILHKSTLALKALDNTQINNHTSEARVHIESIQYKVIDEQRRLETEREENAIDIKNTYRR